MKRLVLVLLLISAILASGCIQGQMEEPDVGPSKPEVGREKTVEPTEEPESKIPEPEAPPEGIVAIFIDVNNYNIMKAEIDQYLSDVKNDLNTNVELFMDNFATPIEVREKLIELKAQGLRGSVLIGDIPIPYFESDVPFCVWGGNVLPTDRYYMDLDSTDFFDEDGDGMFEIQKYAGQYQSEMPSKLYWSGRIKPYSDDIAILKAYFNRNHLYRIGKKRPHELLFVYSPSIESGPVGATPEIYESNVKDEFSGTGLYSRNQIMLSVNISKTEVLTELSKDYESASINAHGDLHNQEIGDGINPEDIVRIKPKPYFYYLLACANGDFSKADYLAGHYLLDGNGLVVVAYTVPTITCATDSNFYMEYLSRGDVFGEAIVTEQYRLNELHITILGDPTLRIRDIEPVAEQDKGAREQEVPEEPVKAIN